MSKVVFVANELGAFRHHREHLARAVKRAGAEPVLLAAPVGDRAGLDYAFRPVDIERFRFDAPRDWRLFVAVFSVLREEQPAVVHLINIKPYLYGGLAAAAARAMGWRGRVVVTVAGLGRLHEPQAERTGSRAWLRRLLVEAFLRIALRGAQVTFETGHDRDVWLRRGLVRPDRVTVTRGTGVDLAQFAACDRQPSRGRLRVLYAGRLLRAKGLEVFLEAAGRVDPEAVEMLVAGFSENDPDAISPGALGAHPHVTFLGQVDAMGELLRGVDVVVLASRYNEGVPRILIEAAAAGCVPVATSFAGSRELIDHGRTGFFLGSDLAGQADELAALLQRLAGERERVGAIGRQAAAHVRAGGFAAEAVAETFLGLYGLVSGQERPQ